MEFLKTTSLKRKLTWVIMLISVTTLIMAVAALLALEAREFRTSLTRELNSIAEVIGGGSKAALEFDDKIAGLRTLSVLQDDPRIIEAGIYRPIGERFARFQPGQASSNHSAEKPGHRGEIKVTT